VRLFVVAGESSGDQLGAQMVNELREQEEVDLRGVGGDALTGVGLKSLFPMSDLSVMGWKDVYLRLPLLLWRLRQTIDAILKQKPDLVVLIDSQEFSNRVAAGVRKTNPAQKIVLYVAPSVWAWKPERAKQILPLYDEVLAVLPFEPTAFEELGGPKCSYVGHSSEYLPLAATQSNTDVLLLPGSRIGEIKRNLSEFEDSIDWLCKNHPEMGARIATLNGLSGQIRSLLRRSNVDVTEGRMNFLAALQSARTAIAVSGTVTLELGFSGIPHITTYLAEPKMMQAWENYGRPLVNLNNIIVGRQFVPEILGTEKLGAAIQHSFVDLIDSEATQEAQIAGFEEVRDKMKEGEPMAPRQNIVERLLSHLN